MGQRKTVEKTIKISPQSLTGSGQTTTFAGRGSATQQTIFTKYKWYIIGAIVLIAGWYLYRKNHLPKAVAAYHKLKEILKRKKYISYPDYLFKRAKKLPFSDPQKDKSVIFLGSLGKGKLEDEIGWYKTIEAFLRQDFLVKAVPSPGHILHNIQSKYWRLACRNPQFELLESIPMNKLGSVVRSCGFGININQKSIFHCKTNFVSFDYLYNCSSSRMFDYAEEGLGTIISPDLKYVKNTWDRSGACMTCGTHEINSLTEMIKNKRSSFSKHKYKNWENENLLENNLSALRNFISIIKTKNKSRKIQKGINSADINFLDKKIYHLQQRLALHEGTLVHASEKNVPVAKKIKRYFIKKSTSVYKRLFAKYYKKIK